MCSAGAPLTLMIQGISGKNKEEDNDMGEMGSSRGKNMISNRIAVIRPYEIGL
jgi:hypothetical protein